MAISEREWRIIRRAETEDEPIIVFRAADILSVMILVAYEDLIEKYSPYGELAVLVSDKIQEFQSWQKAHPERIKFPD